jgi:hypothetical protein
VCGMTFIVGPSEESSWQSLAIHSKQEYNRNDHHVPGLVMTILKSWLWWYLTDSLY